MNRGGDDDDDDDLMKMAQRTSAAQMFSSELRVMLMDLSAESVVCVCVAWHRSMCVVCMHGSCAGSICSF